MAKAHKPKAEHVKDTITLHIREFPRGIVRQARALALQRGCSLREVLVMALETFMAE